MKASFTTNMMNLVPNVNRYGAEVIEHANAEHGGFFTVELKPVQKPGSEEQNRTFHALLNAFFATGCASYDSFQTMRDAFKIRAAGVGEYKVITYRGVITVESIDGYDGYPTVEIPKSWTQFTKAQRSEAIQMVLDEIMASGASSKKLDEIIAGMQEDK